MTGIRMWEVIRLVPVNSDGVVIIHGVSACTDDGETATRYTDVHHVRKPKTIRIEVKPRLVYVSFDKTYVVAEVVEDSRDVFNPVWYKATCVKEDE